MKVKSVSFYFDGGTSEITTDEGVFCIGESMFSGKVGRLFQGYPNRDGSNRILDNLDERKRQLKKALEEYHPEDELQLSIKTTILTKGEIDAINGLP